MTKSVYKTRDATTINTHRGLFRYTRLPYGVSSTPRTFQNLIDKIVKDIPHLFAHLDDILITGKSRHEHLNALDAVMNRLEQVVSG